MLDGLERLLLAYTRVDGARLAATTSTGDTANFVARAVGFPESAGQSFVGQHRLRQTADPARALFAETQRVRGARVLVSSRLYPADFQAASGEPLPGCSALFLSGLEEEDALELWRAFGVLGGREAMLPIFRTFDSFPLLIQMLAGDIASFVRRRATSTMAEGDPGLHPFGFPFVKGRGARARVCVAGFG